MHLAPFLPCHYTVGFKKNLMAGNFPLATLQPVRFPQANAASAQALVDSLADLVFLAVDIWRAVGIARGADDLAVGHDAIDIGAKRIELGTQLLALWLRYNGPDTSLSFEIMMDVLLIVVIGGMGTMYGAAIGAALFMVAQSYLQDLLRLGHEATAAVPWLSALLSPDRWLLWLGVLFVLSVYYFPTGVVGRLRAQALAASKKEGRK